MPTDLDALAALAREATAQWGDADRIEAIIGGDCDSRTFGLVRAYIAAANPAVVLWKAPKVIAASDQEWPAGCHDIISCQKRRVCGYHQCIHTGKGAFLGAEIDAATSDVGAKP